MRRLTVVGPFEHDPEEIVKRHLPPEARARRTLPCYIGRIFPTRTAHRMDEPRLDLQKALEDR